MSGRALPLSVPAMSPDETAVLEEAMNQLSDMVNIVWGDLDGDPLEQVEATREAMRDAGRLLTKYKRRAVARARQSEAES